MMKGAITALVTPFNEQGQVDFDALERMILWQIEEGIDGLVLGGTTGEAPTLSDEELIQVWKVAVRCSQGSIPMIAGTGSNSTRRTVELTKSALAVGMDGCLVIVPYYNRPTPEGCYLHYQAVNEVGLPMIVYHHPGRCGVSLSSEMLVKIAELSSVVGIKEASADLDHTIEVMRGTTKPVFCADDALLMAVLASGGTGVISIVSNVIPRLWKEVVALFDQGQIQEAKFLYDRYYPLVKALVLETNPQCVKFALSVMGKCSAQMRLPLIEPQERTKQAICGVMNQLIQTEMLGVNGAMV